MELNKKFEECNIDFKNFKIILKDFDFLENMCKNCKNYLKNKIDGANIFKLKCKNYIQNGNKRRKLY